MNYPTVVSEFETIKKVLKGYSLARAGDGEAKIMTGEGYSREPKNRALTAELLDTFTHPHKHCLLAIPTMAPEGPKYENWLRHERRILSLLQAERTYYSAFVSRPDSAPWINVREYALLFQKLWKGKRAVVLCEPDSSTIKVVKLAAEKAVHIMCPHEKAFAHIDKLEKKIVDSKPEVVIMSCGPTASILANRLARRRIHAVDFGSAGGFLLRLLKT